MATVLIFARDEVVAALLGLLVELCGYEPAYAKTRESAASACARLTPSTAVIESDHLECSHAVVGALRDSGIKVVLFSASGDPGDLKRVAANLGTSSFTLPVGPEAFGKYLA